MNCMEELFETYISGGAELFDTDCPAGARDDLRSGRAVGCRPIRGGGSSILTNQRLGLVSYTPDSVVSFVRISWIINTKDQWRPTDPVSGLC